MDSGSDTTERREAPQSPGAILAAERERQGLARADIAQRLHMSVSQVEALEASDYERLPRGTFLKGFTRNYARALGLDADAVMGLLAQDAPRESSPDIVVPSQNIRFDPLGQRLANPYVKAAGIAFVLVALGFAAMYWWLFIRPQGLAQATAVKKPAVEVSAPAPAPPEAPAASPPAAAAPAQSPAAGAPPANSPAGPAASPAAEPSQAPAAPAAEAPRVAGPGEGTIRLAFRGAAWVEITDARGKVLLSRTHPGGSNTEVIGKPPFGLVIGNAPEVSVTYNGRDVDLAPHTRVAVARLTLP